MSTVTTLVLDFSGQQSEEECPLLYLEVPQDEVTPGDELELRLWGAVSSLGGWSLMCCHEPLGPGIMGRLSEPEYTQQLDFAASTHARLDYPFMSIGRVETLTPLVRIDAAAPCPPKLWAGKGRDITSHVSRKGYSCLRLGADTPLYGSVLATVIRVATFRSWFWTVPENTYGDIWFFLYSDTARAPYRSFSLALPELAATAVGERNLTIRTVDFASEATISNASVYLDGHYKGLTNDNGRLDISGVTTGTHSFRAVKDGYLDTDLDGLSNDSIVVE